MKKQFRILMLGLFVASVFSGILLAERRPGQGEVRGTFVALAERGVGEREYLAIVIKPRESDDHVTVLVPRKEDFLHAARTLQKGDKVEIGYVVEGGQKWLKTIGIERVRRIETERRLRDVEEKREVRRPRREKVEEERERPRRDPERGEADELRGVFRRLWERLERMEGELKELFVARLDRMEREFKQLITVRLERMERELKELRAENARLRRQLQERRVLLKREPAREVRELREREEQEKAREQQEKARRERAERREREEGREREETEERREAREREGAREREERE